MPGGPSLLTRPLTQYHLFRETEDEFEKDEFDGLKKENIIEGERQHRTGGYADAENKADAMIEGAVNANGASLPSSSLLCLAGRN